MVRPAAASSPGSGYGRRRDILNPNPWRTWPRLRRQRRGDDMLSRTCSCSLLRVAVDGAPHPAGGRRHLKLVIADRIRDGLVHCDGAADLASFAAAFDSERIARA